MGPRGPLGGGGTTSGKILIFLLNSMEYLAEATGKPAATLDVSETAICEAALSSLQRDFPRAQEAMSGLPDELVDERNLESVRQAFSRFDSSTPTGIDGDGVEGVSAWTKSTTKP